MKLCLTARSKLDLRDGGLLSLARHGCYLLVQDTGWGSFEQRLALHLLQSGARGGAGGVASPSFYDARLIECSTPSGAETCLNQF